MRVAELCTAIMKKLLQAVTVSLLFLETLMKVKQAVLLCFVHRILPKILQYHRTALVIKKISNTVTVNDSYAENSGSGEYSEGETVTIKAGERSGYKFSGWTTDDSVQFADSKSAETTFTMPSKAVTVTANWTKSSGGNGGGGGNVCYTVSFETNGGNDIASKTVTRNSVIKRAGNTDKGRI